MLQQAVGRVFKSAKDTEFLLTRPNTASFVCDKSLAELTALGHRKTLAWIDRFRGLLNPSVPNKDTFWNNLSNDSFSGSDKIRLFTGMNPERRIFYGLLAIVHLDGYWLWRKAKGRGGRRGGSGWL
ncbi:MAG: hypothetical protein LBI54_02540 [Lachnospiraceae bacterium]|nr:hypothetical protein [Lachnospiraceae bacterium]